MFLFKREDFVPMAKGKKVYRMSSFYQKARKSLDILVDENQNPLEVSGLLMREQKKNS